MIIFFFNRQIIKLKPSLKTFIMASDSGPLFSFNKTDLKTYDGSKNVCSHKYILSFVYKILHFFFRYLEIIHTMIFFISQKL